MSEEEYNTCPNCGAPVTPLLNFCVICAAKMNEEKTTEDETEKPEGGLKSKHRQPKT